MFNCVETKKGEDVPAGFREWVHDSSEESGWDAVAHQIERVWLRATRTRVRLAAVCAAGPAGRFVPRGIDLVTEQWAPVLRLVKLEPLNEP